MAVDEFSDYPNTGASGSQEFTSSEDSSIDYTSKNQRNEYVKDNPDQSFGAGATGNVSTSGKTSSGGGLGAPFIHPFKIQKVTNPDDNSTKVRIYEGDVYAKIDTFELDLISITTSVESYSTADPPAGPSTKEQSLGSHSITFSDVTAQMPQHQHDVDGGAVYIPQHKHLARDSSEDGLVMPNHKHAAGSNLTATAGSTSADTGFAGGHVHSAGTYKIPEHQHIQGGTAKAKSGTGSGGITTGTTEDAGGHSHGSGGYNIPEHNHKAQEGSNKLLIPQHTHLPRNSSGDGLVMPNHKHQYNKDDHSHDVTGNTASGTSHTHPITGLSAPMGDHYHTSGEASDSGGTAAGQQLKFRQHTHSSSAHTHPLPTTTGTPTSGTGGGGSGGGGSGGSSGGMDSDPNHTHDLGGNTSSGGGGSTGNVSSFGVDDSGGLAPEDITGNTGGIGHSLPSQSLSGTLGNESSHTHPLSSDVTAAAKTSSNITVGDTTEVKDYDGTDGDERRITGNTGNVTTDSSTALEVTGNTGGLSTSTSTAITGNSEVQAAHGHTYNKDDHSHDLDDTTQTGNVYNKASNDQIIGNSSTESNHKHSYIKDDHTHSVTGDTTEVTDYDTDVNEKRVTGDTGSVKEYSTEANKKCTGTTGDVRNGSSSTLPNFTISVSGSSSSSGLNHSHLVPALTSASTTHKFVAVKGQAQAQLDVPTNFTNTFNNIIQFEDGTDSIFRFHESSHSSGDFYVKWVITINSAAVVQNIVGSIERVAVGAGAPADVSFGALNQDPDVTSRKLSRTDPTFNGSNDTTKLVGTFHQKIGSVSATTVDQVQFSNINWSMTVLPEVS